MKNKILYIVVFALAAFTLVGCQKITTEGMTRITYYAELTIEGSPIITVAKGTSYVDPGYSATMQGEDVTEQVKVTSNVDMSKSGAYTVDYAIANADGFAKTGSRTVVVADPNDPIEGGYIVDPASFRMAGTTKVVYGGQFQIVVLSDGNGNYRVNDLYGGYYCQRAGYGTDYNMGGLIAIDGSEVTMLKSDLVPWGDTASGFYEGKWDTATKTLSWQLDYAAMIFHVTMSKK